MKPRGRLTMTCSNCKETVPLPNPHVQTAAGLAVRWTCRQPVVVGSFVITDVVDVVDDGRRSLRVCVDDEKLLTEVEVRALRDALDKWLKNGGSDA